MLRRCFLAGVMLLAAVVLASGLSSPVAAAAVTAAAAASPTGGSLDSGVPVGREQLHHKLRSHASAPTPGPLPVLSSLSRGGRVFVSGVSSGGFMATQLHFSYSSVVDGVGVFAGGPYGCAQGSVLLALESCMATSIPLNLGALEESTLGAAKLGAIDPLEHMRGAPVWLFHGTADTTVAAPVADALALMYSDFGADVAYNNSVTANHAWVSPLGVNPCAVSQPPYTSNCPNDDFIDDMLSHLLGRTPNAPVRQLAGQLLPFSQDLYALQQWHLPASMLSMDSVGYVYVPPACGASNSSGAVCDLMLVLHGCEQSYSLVGESLIQQSGLSQYADSNNLVLLFPQTVAMQLGVVVNPKACWDWWGYLAADSSYATKGGYQIETLVSMMAAMSNDTAHKITRARQQMHTTN